MRYEFRFRCFHGDEYTQVEPEMKTTIGPCPTCGTEMPTTLIGIVAVAEVVIGTTPSGVKDGQPSV